MTDNNNDNCNYDDVGEAIREGRPLRQASRYRFRFAQDKLNFRNLEVNDPVPLGRQILTAAGLDAGDGFSLSAILATGDFEDVRLDEPFDLRGRGAERFVAFQTDRVFKLTLKGHELEWGKPGASWQLPLRAQQSRQGRGGVSRSPWRHGQAH
ncbi:MAG TPA: multiubiquitin domain-containing protein [Chthoniobacterales bacterium]